MANLGIRPGNWEQTNSDRLKRSPEGLPSRQEETSREKHGEAKEQRCPPPLPAWGAASGRNRLCGFTCSHGLTFTLKLLFYGNRSRYLKTEEGNEMVDRMRHPLPFLNPFISGGWTAYFGGLVALMICHPHCAMRVEYLFMISIAIGSLVIALVLPIKDVSRMNVGNKCKKWMLIVFAQLVTAFILMTLASFAFSVFCF